MAETQPWPDPSVVPPPDITSSTGGPISAPGAALGEQQFPGVGADPYSATALQPRHPKQTSAPASVDQMPIGPEAEINKATGYDAATGRVQPGGIYDLTRQKQEATEAANQRLINAEQEQLRQLREAHKAVAASPNDLQSWDAKKEQAKYSVTPTEAALNPGFWLAIAASAFTRTPMVNALNGAAASINALKDGKDEEYKRAYDAWRQNSELAVKRHELMHQDYEDAIQLYDKDVDMARQQAMQVAMKYDDKLALAYLRNGLDDKMIGLVDKRDQMFKDWAQTNAALPEHQVRQDVYNGMMKQINDFKQQRNLPNNAPEIIALRNRAAVALGAKTDNDEARAQAMFQWQLDHANDHDGNGPNPDEVFKKTNEMEAEAAQAKHASLFSKGSPEMVGNIAQAIADGDQPPILTGLYGMSGPVRAQLEQGGFNLAKAQMEWTQAQRQISSLNGPQMQRFIGLASSVNNTIDEVRDLSQQMGLRGITAFNRAELQTLINTAGNTEKGQLAARYMAAINTLKEEFASLAQGGYAPHESAWALADQQINGNYGVNELDASLTEVRRLINYRVQGILGMSKLGPGAPNRYTGQQGGSAQEGSTKPVDNAAGWSIQEVQ